MKRRGPNLTIHWTKPRGEIPIELMLRRYHGWVALMLWTYPQTVQPQPAPLPHELTVDFQQTNGTIRALHGVNFGPLCYRGTVDMSAYHQQLAIPLTRLHDVPWVNAEAVDIHTVFPDFRDDPERPENYRFGPTDDYIGAITNVPSQIVYRLGESIEHTARKYFVHPPSDPKQWAAVCLGIIRHYNHGWAQGFKHNIRYWEIWNEPDVRPAMWTGSDEEYFQLYEAAAKAIKKTFPELKVGGPAVGGSGEFVGDSFQPSPFVERFLTYCREHQVPLDFFSWHRYTSRPWDLPKRALAVRHLLDASGFQGTESHLNEWNYLPNDDWGPLTREGQGVRREAWYEAMAGPKGAAFAACGLILLQDGSIDAANFYTGDVQGFGLFSFAGVPKASFYAFKAFRGMLETPIRVPVAGSIPDEVAVLAGVNASGNRAALLVSHFAGSTARFRLQLKPCPWTGPCQFQVSLVDAKHSLTPVIRERRSSLSEDFDFTLEAPGVALVQWTKP